MDSEPPSPRAEQPEAAAAPLGNAFQVLMQGAGAPPANHPKPTRSRSKQSKKWDVNQEHKLFGASSEDDDEGDDCEEDGSEDDEDELDEPNIDDMKFIAPDDDVDEDSQSGAGLDNARRALEADENMGEVLAAARAIKKRAKEQAAKPVVPPAERIRRRIRTDDEAEDVDMQSGIVEVEGARDDARGADQATSLHNVLEGNDANALLEAINKMGSSDYQMPDEPFTEIRLGFLDMLDQGAGPSPDSLTGFLHTLLKRYDLDKGQLVSMDTARRLFGGPVAEGELNLEQRFKAHLEFYLTECKMLHLLFKARNMFQGAGGPSLACYFSQINDVLHSMCNLRVGESKLRNTVQNSSDHVERNHDPFNSQVTQERYDSLKGCQKVMLYLANQCNDRGYRKLGRYLYRQKRNDEGHATHAWEKYLTMRKFILQITDKRVSFDMWEARTSVKNNIDFIEQDAIENEDEDIPFLVRHRRRWATRKHYYDACADKWYRLGRDRLPSEQCCKYIDAELTDLDGDIDPVTGKTILPIGPHYTCHKGVYKDSKGKTLKNGLHKNGKSKKEWKVVNGVPTWRRWMDIKTPMMDRMLTDQKFPIAVRKWIYVFLGRLAFQLGIQNGGDNWQVCLLLYGRAGTGKSTLVRHMLNMYDDNDIFELESNGESIFQLQKAVDPLTDEMKWVWRIMELKKDLRLSAARYQQMVSGERMVIPRKNRDPWEGDCTMPGIQVGNDRLPYKDAQGSVARRTPTVEFNTRITPDTQYMERLKAELPNCIRKCIQGYLITRDEIGTKGIFDVLPDYFKKTSANLRKEIDPAADYFSENSQRVKFTNNHQHDLVPWEVLRQDMDQWWSTSKHNGDPTNKPTDEAVRQCLEDSGKAVVGETWKEGDVEQVIEDDEDIKLAERKGVVIRERPANAADAQLQEAIESAMMAESAVDRAEVGGKNYFIQRNTGVNFDDKCYKGKYVSGIRLYTHIDAKTSFEVVDDPVLQEEAHPEEEDQELEHPDIIDDLGSDDDDDAN